MRVVVLLFGLVACVRSHAVVCDDGSVCPEDYRCDETRHACISPAQVRACAGTSEGDACAVDTGAGHCVGGACELPVCGDGVREGTEECDGADLGGADCTSSALIHAQFYAPAGLTCTAGCTYDIAACAAYCGDGAVNGPEVCDGVAPPSACVELGFDAGATTCNDLCGYGFDSCARFGFVFEGVGPGYWLGVGGTGHADQWAVGDAGQIAHYNGHAWTTVASNVTSELEHVAAIAPADAWAIGPAAITHWNGLAWAAVAGPAGGGFHDVWAAGASAVYVASDQGVARWDGAAWQAMPGIAGPVFAVAGTGANDLWAAGTDALYHWNGSTWTVSAMLAARRLLVFSPTAVWAVGTQTTAVGSAARIAHWNGSAWDITDDVTTLQLDVAGSADNDVWVVASSGKARHWNGHGFAEVGLALVNGVHAFGPGDVVVGGVSGVWRFRGQAFIEENIPLPAGSPGAVWADQPSHVVVGDTAGRIHVFDGGAWLPQLPAGASVTTMFGFGPDDVFVGRLDGKIEHLTGGALVDTHAISNVLVSQLWGTSNHDLWAIATSVSHYDGVTWTSVPTGTATSVQFTAISGTAPDDVWIVGADQLGSTGAVVMHWDGTAFTVVDTSPVSEIVAVARDEMYGIAGSDRVLHYAGGQHTEIALTLLDPLRWIAATGPDDIIAASQREVRHFDGARWSPLRVPAPFGGMPAITAISMTPGALTLTQLNSFPSLQVLIRTRPWACRAHETSCDDGVDDDCDDLIDARDADCP